MFIYDLPYFSKNLPDILINGLQLLFLWTILFMVKSALSHAYTFDGSFCWRKFLDTLYANPPPNMDELHNQAIWYISIKENSNVWKRYLQNINLVNLLSSRLSNIHYLYRWGYFALTTRLGWPNCCHCYHSYLAGLQSTSWPEKLYQCALMVDLSKAWRSNSTHQVSLRSSIGIHWRNNAHQRLCGSIDDLWD